MSDPGTRLVERLGRPAAADDVLGALYERRLSALVCREVLTPTAAAALALRLEAGALEAEGVAATRFAREFEAFSYGPCLDQCEGELDGYLARVGPFEAALFAVARGVGLELEAALGALLAALAGARPLTRPRARDGRPYSLFTVRRLPVGGRIPPHAENEQLLRAPYRELGPLLDPTAVLSWYLTLARAEQGGELALYPIAFESLDRAAFRHEHSDAEALVRAAAPRLVSPDAGDLLVFDGGRRVHEVLPVRGTRARWTLGGFVARSRDGDEVLAWG